MNQAWARRPQRFPQPALLVGGLVWLVLVATLAIAVERERQQAIDHARQQAATLTTVLEQSTARTFDSVEIALAALATYLARQDFPANDASVRELMRARLQYLPPVRALFVIGPDGRILHDTDFPNTPDVLLGDRPYFRQYLARPELQHALSPALQSRSGTGWFVASTHRITGRAGEFKGIVVAAVQLDWLSALFEQLQLQPGQTLGLLQEDGRLVARHPADNDLVGRSYAQLPVFTDHLPRSRSGVYLTDGPPLGYSRIVSYRALVSQPLVVTLTTPLDTVLAAWRRTAYGALGVGVVLALLTAAGILFFLQRQQEARRAVAHRVAEAQALAAAEANAKFRTFFEQGCFFSCVLSLDGTVLEANHAGLEACAIGRDQVIGRKFWDCGWWTSSEARTDALQAAVAAAARGETAHIDTAYRLAGGEQMLVELVLSPVRAGNGKVLSVAALAVDITQRKHQEERLRALADELAKADRLKGEFLATLSHELRNVLAPVQNAIGIIERVDPGTPPALRARDMLKKQVLQMRRLVDDLLDVSRLNSGKMGLEREHVDLRQLLLACAEAAHPFMEGPGHRLSTRWPDEPLPVYVDRGRLQQVLLNLLGNAAKYTPAGGHIQLNAHREGREVLVEVVDNGMGIPLDAQARVFDMFEQVSEHVKRSQGGLGIGLSLVQKLVGLHGGHVEAFSPGPGRGSTFTVYLPLDEHGGAGRDTALHPQASGSSGRA